MEEIWKTAQFIRKDGSIEIFEGYEISNLGRVKSLGNNKTRKEKILKPCACGKLGHQLVNLHKNNKTHPRSIHRLVLSTFDPVGWFEKAVVDHIDSNPKNNRLENLHWVTYKENNSTEHAIRAQSKAKKGFNNPNSQPCVYDRITFDCIKEAYRYAKANGYTKTYCTFKNMIKKRN